jgi:prevent-host-death family protein
MRMSVAKIRNNLAEALNRAAYAGERVILERRGKPVAALVSIDDVELLERLEDEADLRAARKARKEGGKPIPFDHVMAELGIDVKPKAKRRRRTA